LTNEKGEKMQEKYLNESITSALKKIQGLGKDLGLPEEQLQQIMDSPAMKELKETVETEELPLEDLPDSITIPWEEVTELYNMKLELQEIQNYLAQFCVRYEVTKSKVLSDMDQVQQQMNQVATHLRMKNKIPSSASYEIEIPDEPEQPGIMRKIKAE